MEKFSCEIYGYGYDGEGVGRLDGKVVFLPYALKGEIVEFEKTQEKSKFIKGKATSISRQNSHRCEAPCPYFQRCGGCTLQHADYEYEIEIKKDLLISQLKKVGFLGQVEIFKSPEDYGYRNKIRMFVGKEGLSLKERESNNLVGVKRCLLVSDKMNEALQSINSFILNRSLKGDISEVIIREERGFLLINFVRKSDKEINYQGVYLMLGSNCGIFETIRGKCIHKLGIKGLSTNEMGLDCLFSMTSFHQVNTYLTEQLYQGVINHIVGKKVINCYSGAGVLSGVIAMRGIETVGIELGESEHLDAEELKNRNDLTNLTNVCGDCAEVLGETDFSADTIIVDPPRSGLSETVCQSLNKKKCKRLIYVSCNSATLIRDLQRLDSFLLEKVCLYDMFPRTGEYEALCILSHKA